ncbi:MAG: 50S ribosomal protein L11 methyltransferase [Chthoniobacterales bacterium]|nr:50S ribosomal protein L11 methyltransferase [Chthoniobacterales bacterium]
MQKRLQNYIWQKAVTASWLGANEELLHEQTKGSYATIERPGTSRALLEAFCETRPAAEGLKWSFGGSIRPLPSDWRERFFAAHRTAPLKIGRRLIIAGENTGDTAGPRLIIPAGVAFGTGEHATTAMSLRLLGWVTRPLPCGWRMLDAGTGSGILALAGWHFGARKVLGIDNDPMALATAKENARRNRIRGVTFVVGDVQKRIRGTFDVITANLYSELLVSVLPTFRESLVAEGSLILSGVLRQQERELTAALRAAEFRAAEIRRRGKWIALLCVRR